MGTATALFTTMEVHHEVDDVDIGYYYRVCQYVWLLNSVFEFIVGARKLCTSQILRREKEMK